MGFYLALALPLQDMGQTSSIFFLKLWRGCRASVIACNLCASIEPNDIIAPLNHCTTGYKPIYTPTDHDYSITQAHCVLL